MCLRTYRYRPSALAGPRLLAPGTLRGGPVPVTNFEAKYLVSGQPTYELLLGASVGEEEEEGGVNGSVAMGGGGVVEESNPKGGARFFLPRP